MFLLQMLECWISLTFTAVRVQSDLCRPRRMPIDDRAVIAWSHDDHGALTSHVVAILVLSV